MDVPLKWTLSIYSFLIQVLIVLSLITNAVIQTLSQNQLISYFPQTS